MVKEFIDLYFQEYSLIKQQIDSYNKFIEVGLQRVVDSIGVIKTNVEGFEIKLGRIKVEMPRHTDVRSDARPILPIEARMRNLTYQAPLYLEMIPVRNGIEKPVFSEVFIGEIPVMLKSKICYLSSMSEQELIEAGEDPRDPGGYFIINGSERVLISIEDLASNRLLVTREKDEKIVAKVFSAAEGFRTKVTVTRLKQGKWLADFPSTPPNLPLIPLLAVLLGKKTSEEVVDEFEYTAKETYNDLLLNVEEYPVEDAVEYLSRRIAPGQPLEHRLNRMWYALDNYLLPHLGMDEKARVKKAKYLMWMAERTTMVAHRKLLQDDKDHYRNKRIKLAGDLMEDLFRYAFNFLVKDIVYQASRAAARGRKLQVQTLVRQDALEDRIIYSMATGNWISGQTGVSQLLERSSFLGSLSQRRRIVSPLSKSHPHFLARDLHGTQYGKICPSETPEGPGTSLVKNLALFGEISIGEDEKAVEAKIKPLGVEDL